MFGRARVRFRLGQNLENPALEVRQRSFDRGRLAGFVLGLISGFRPGCAGPRRGRFDCSTGLRANHGGEGILEDASPANALGNPCEAGDRLVRLALVFGLTVRERHVLGLLVHLLVPHAAHGNSKQVHPTAFALRSDDVSQPPETAELGIAEAAGEGDSAPGHEGKGRTAPASLPMYSR